MTVTYEIFLEEEIQRGNPTRKNERRDFARDLVYIISQTLRITSRYINRVDSLVCARRNGVK